VISDQQEGRGDKAAARSICVWAHLRGVVLRWYT